MIRHQAVGSQLDAVRSAPFGKQVLVEASSSSSKKTRWRRFPRCVTGCALPGTMILGSRDMRLVEAATENV